MNIKENFQNSLRLFRLYMRRDRRTTLIWLIGLVLFSIVLAPGMGEMFYDEAMLSQLANINDNPIMVAMMGPMYNVDSPTVGSMYGGLMLLWYAITIAIMNIFLIVRHSRADEEGGRSEVIRSLPVGRLAGIHAAMLSSLALNTLLALFTGLGLAATGTAGMPFGACMLYGALAGAVGLAFAAITALFCQLSSSSGGAVGMSMASLGVFYMIRAAGDAQDSDLIACLSPLGLAHRSQVFVNNYLWPLFILLPISLVISAVAYRLAAIRDLGQGFIAAKPGRSEAGAMLQSSTGLALRLLRGGVITWFIVMFIAGASYGSVFGDIDEMVSNSPGYLQAIGIPAELVAVMSDADKGKIIAEYFSVFVTIMMTLLCMVPVLIAAKKVRSEEIAGRTEHIIARAVSRGCYLAAYVAVAVVASVLIQFATAVGLYYSANAVSETPLFEFGDMMAAYFAYLPAVWVMIGVAVFVVGACPKATGAVWGYFGFVAFSSFIGRMLDLPEWLGVLSPLYHVPMLPLEEFSWPPLLTLTGVAAILIAAGFVTYGRRDTLSGV